MAVKASSVAPTIRYPRTCRRTSCAYSSVSCSTGEISGGLFIVREDRRAETRRSKPDRRSARKGRPLLPGWPGVLDFADRCGCCPAASCNKKQVRPEDVRAVQAGDGKITREIRTVFRQKHVGVLDIFFLNSRDFVRGRLRPKMRSIHRWISRVGIDRVECDLVLFDVRVGQSLFVVKVPGDFLARWQAFFEEMFVPQILFIFSQ